MSPSLEGELPAPQMYRRSKSLSNEREFKALSRVRSVSVPAFKICTPFEDFHGDSSMSASPSDNFSFAFSPARVGQGYVSHEVPQDISPISSELASVSKTKVPPPSLQKRAKSSHDSTGTFSNNPDGGSSSPMAPTCISGSSGGKMHSKSLKKSIRSNGGLRSISREANFAEFPHVELYAMQEFRSLSASGFSVSDEEGQSTDDYYVMLYGNESPFPDYSAGLKSPHEPPHEAEFTDATATLRQDIIRQQNTQLFASTDGFTNFIEERLVRWRPSDSQQNNELSLGGKHPYQQMPTLLQTQGSVRIFSSIKTWLGMVEIQSPQEHLSNPQVETGPQTADITRIFSSVAFKPNSQASLVVPSPSSSGRTNPGVLVEEPKPIPEPAYTPEAVLLSELELSNVKGRDIQSRSNGRETLEQNEVGDIVDGIDNFITGCLESTSNFACGAIEKCF